MLFMSAASSVLSNYTNLKNMTNQKPQINLLSVSFPAAFAVLTVQFDWLQAVGNS